MKTNIDKGRIVKALAGFYYIDDGHEVHQCRARGKFRKQDIKPVVGDFVEFQKGNHDDGYLLKILERKNVLRRPPIANIDQALLVFSRKEPDFSTILLDKFLLLIEHYHIRPIIVISKMDIEGDDSIYQYIQEYRNAGYTVIETSSKQNKGIDEIKEIFKDQVTVITGQSGVGKSTLLNALDISLNLETNQISKAPLVGFYKRLIKKLYRKRGELKDCNEINEIYVIAFECLYKEDGETPAYVIYEENMLCLSSINALTQMCQEVIDNYYCELTSEIQKELEEE